MQRSTSEFVVTYPDGSDETFPDHGSASRARKERGGELRTRKVRGPGGGYEVRLDGVVLGRHPNVQGADRQARKNPGATIHVV